MKRSVLALIAVLSVIGFERYIDGNAGAVPPDSSARTAASTQP